MRNSTFNPFYDDQDSRHVLADHLIAQGASSAPVQNIWQGLTRLGSAALGGYLGHEEKQQREDDYNAYHATLADALNAPDLNSATKVLQKNPYTSVMADKLMGQQLFNKNSLENLQAQQNLKLEGDARKREQALDQAQKNWDMRLDYTPNIEAARQQAITDGSVGRVKELGAVREDLKSTSFANQQEREEVKPQKKLENQSKNPFARKRKNVSGGFNIIPD